MNNLKNTQGYKLLSACMAVSLLLSACNKGIDPDPRTPVKLIQVSQPEATLTQVFAANLQQDKNVLKRIGTANANLQVAITDGGLLAANGSTVQLLGANGVIWRTNVGEVISSGVGFDEASQTAIVTTEKGNVIALDATTGSQRWQSALKTVVLAPAVIAGNRVLLSANDGVLYGLNLQSGATVWQYTTQSPNISVRGTAMPLRLDADTAVFATADGRIHALMIDSGKVAWTRRVGAAVGGNDIGRMSDVDGVPYVHGNRLYVTSYSGQFVAFDMSTGRTMFVERDFSTTKSITMLSGTAIGVDTDGMVYGFNAESGAKLWQNNALKFRKPSNPVSIGRYVAIGDYEGVVHLFNQSGDLIGRTDGKNKGQIISLQAKNDRLYAQTSQGQVLVWQVN